jgi:predicted O-methyltransferase YrrM
MEGDLRQEGIPAMDGRRYLSLIDGMHERLGPAWYLEVGTFQGRSLQLARCNYVAVDPGFRISRPVIPPQGRAMHLFQQTSDDFFASGFLGRNDIRIDLAFLDGMHLFEYLLRDFINTEKAMAPGGVILLHDCCPTTEEMAARDMQPGAWTGDVWKTLLILLRRRPDLDISVATAAPTGLVVIRNLDPGNTALADDYDGIVEEYSALSFRDFDGGLAGFYREIPLVSPRTALARLSAPGS